MAYSDLSGSKLRRRLGATLNESVAAPVASFARRQLERMGWTEGTGLGRNRDGMVGHIRAKKREEEMGLGHEKRKAEEAGDAWWASSVGETLSRLSRRNGAASDGSQRRRRKKKKRRKDEEDDSSERRAKKKRRKEKRKASADASSSSGEYKVYTDQELFVATGGARFGMRAQRRAEAKWARTESGSELWEREEEARRNIEWNGLGRAVLRLPGDAADGGRGKGDATTEGAGEAPPPPAEGAIEERSSAKSSGKTQKRKREERDRAAAAIAEVTPQDSGDEEGERSPEGGSDDGDPDGEKKSDIGRDVGDDSARRKRSKKEKKKKRRTDGKKEKGDAVAPRQKSKKEKKKKKERRRKSAEDEG